MTANTNIPEFGSPRPRHNHHGFDPSSDPELQREHQKWQEEQARNKNNTPAIELNNGNMDENRSNEDALHNGNISGEEK